MAVPNGGELSLSLVNRGCRLRLTTAVAGYIQPSLTSKPRFVQLLLTGYSPPCSPDPQKGLRLRGVLFERHDALRQGIVKTIFAQHLLHTIATHARPDVIPDTSQ